MYRTILVPIDVSHPETGKAAVAAASELMGADARLTLLAVIPAMPNLVASQLPPDYEGKAASGTEAELKRIASNGGLAEGSYALAIRHGSVHHEILDEARKVSADLIVVVSHRPEVADYLLGTVAAKVVRHANCSVLVVRR